MTLPGALRSAVQDLLEGRSRREMAERVQTTSAGYRAGAASARLVRDAVDAAAYLAVRMPATYAAVAAAAREVAITLPHYAPRSLLDMACGPGTAAFACVEAWPSIEQATMVDANRAMLDAARHLAQSSSAPALRHATIREARAQDVLASLCEADHVVVAYALVECSQAVAVELVAKLWTLCRGVLLLVEPGSREGFERLRHCRAALLQAGGHVAAPCPHDLPCPMTAPDWCHMSERLPRLRDHRIAKGASVPFEDEKFAYLAVTRERPSRATARIVAPPKLSKARWSARVCAGGTLDTIEIARRDPRYRRMAKRRWGDAIDIAEDGAGETSGVDDQAARS